MIINAPRVSFTFCYDYYTGDQLERLLILESEFGALPGITPAVDAVIEFLNTVRSTINATDKLLG